jgi:hypothetical protein
MKIFTLLSAFPMFVPSLSWYNDAFFGKMAQNMRFLTWSNGWDSVHRIVRLPAAEGDARLAILTRGTSFRSTNSQTKLQIASSIQNLSW